MDSCPPKRGSSWALVVSIGSPVSITRWMIVRLMANSLGLIDSCSQLRAMRVVISPWASRSIRKPRSAPVSRTMVSITRRSTSSSSSEELTASVVGQRQQLVALLLHRRHLLAELVQRTLQTGNLLERLRREGCARTRCRELRSWPARALKAMICSVRGAFGFATIALLYREGGEESRCLAPRLRRSLRLSACQR